MLYKQVEKGGAFFDRIQFFVGEEEGETTVITPKIAAKRGDGRSSGGKVVLSDGGVCQIE